MNKLTFTSVSLKQYNDLEKAKSKLSKFKAVKKCLHFMRINLRHPSLNTHEYSELSRTFGLKVFESYAENNTSGAYRVFWHYGPDANEITILLITPHP